MKLLLSTIVPPPPPNRERLVKQVKDRFGRIKKRVAWFCGSYKEASALYASGESDADLKKRAMQTYEADHPEDGPFMFEHCWVVLKSNQNGMHIWNAWNMWSRTRGSLVLMMKWGNVSL